MEEMITALHSSLFIFVCAGSSLLWGLLSSCGSQASHHCGFSCCRRQALGAWASGVAAQGLISCGLRALERAGFSSCGARA